MYYIIALFVQQFFSVLFVKNGKRKYRHVAHFILTACVRPHRSLVSLSTSKNGIIQWKLRTFYYYCYYSKVGSGWPLNRHFTFHSSAFMADFVNMLRRRCHLFHFHSYIIYYIYFNIHANWWWYCRPTHNACRLIW